MADDPPEEQPNIPPKSAERIGNETVTGRDDRTVTDQPDLPQVEGLKGRNVGHYVLLEELGHGGQGFVWLAEDTRLRRKVALKMLATQAAMSEQARLRFLREAEVASKLDHPGICGVHEFGDHEGVAYIAMPFLEGETLDKKIRSALENEESDDAKSFVTLVPPDSETVGDSESSHSLIASGRRDFLGIVHFIEDAARALHAAHEAGLIHRDIKPGNIMAKTDGRAVLLDFGLARDDSEAGQTLTQSGDVLGTPAYMSPEQLLALEDGGVDHRSDIYSLGVTLFECLTLQRPFSAPNREALYQAILSKDAPPLRRVNPSMPQDLEIVVGCALDKNRDRRPHSALEFAEELRRVRLFEPIQSRPVGPWTRTVRWAQRNPVVAMLASVLFVALVIGVIWTQMKNREITRESDKKDEAIAAMNTALEMERQALLERMRMSDVKRVANASMEADLLWPPHPGLIERLEAWQKKYAPLIARLPEHFSALARLREDAQPYTEGDRRRDFADLLREIDMLEQSKEALETRLDDQDDPAPKLEAQAEKTERQVETLRRRYAESLLWRFGEDVDTQFMHDTYAQLVDELERLAESETGAARSIERRLAVSRDIEQKTVSEHAEAWKEAIEGIRNSPEYDGLVITPQIGMIPLGADPTTGFFEFLHWLSHARDAPLPKRDARGRFEVTAETGIILVLLPGGTFRMGARLPKWEGESGPNIDPRSRMNESPAQDVSLDPFFMGKHEVTRGQWVRMSETADPSHWNFENSNRLMKNENLPRYPVEQVTWTECDRAAKQVGLLLPTEAQWEYGCRAGTSSVYFFGDELTKMKFHDNIADQEYKKVYGNNAGESDPINDAYGLLAPVGMFAPNQFGLFDVHGNVQEWCRDAYGTYGINAVEPGTGLRIVRDKNMRVYRGGSFNAPSLYSRSASRSQSTPNGPKDARGFRVSAAIDGF